MYYQPSEEERIRTYPHYELELKEKGKGLSLLSIAKIAHVEDPFLQALVNEGALISPIGGFLLVTDTTCSLFSPYQTHMEIEMLATYENFRCQGHATQLLKVLCEVADQTYTVLMLSTSSIHAIPENGIPNHIIMTTAKAGNNQLPPSMLRPWFEKLGFATLGRVEGGWRMKRNPTI
jgi:hypothetical protein